LKNLSDEAAEALSKRKAGSYLSKDAEIAIQRVKAK
jgi:hypothetical protein